MKIKPIKLFSVIVTVTIMSSLLATGGLVYADSHADAYAEADGTDTDTDGYACDESYAEATANANGNIEADYWDEYLSDLPKSTAIANATSDSESYAEAEVWVWGDENGNGWITGISNATATNGGDAFSQVNGIVDYDRYDGIPEAQVFLVGNAIANGEDSYADVWIGEDTDDEEGWWADSYWGGWISYDSSGNINVTANATANGESSDADTEVDEVSIYEYSAGTINITANAASNGDSRGYVDIEEVGIYYSTGIINLKANSTATGTESYAEINGVYLWLDDGSAGNIDAIITSNAKDGGSSYASADSALDDGDTGNLFIYSIANASGQNSYARSDVDVWGLIPAGAYYDVAADGNAFAIALLISDGTNVWAISYTDAQNGGAAFADVWSGEGTGAEAGVGIHTT